MYRYLKLNNLYCSEKKGFSAYNSEKKQIEVISHVSDHYPTRGKLACLATMDRGIY